VIAYDSARSQIVYVVGYSSAGWGQTWLWDGSSWSPTAATAPLTIYPAIAFDAQRGNLVLFGGGAPFPSSSVLNQTWTWDGETWTQRQPATSPPGRSAGSITYDPISKHVVLFGGNQAYPFNSLNDSWFWDGNTWTQDVTTVSPPPRGVAAIAYDQARQNVVLFGGGTNETTSGVSHLVYDHDTWTLQSVSTSGTIIVTTNLENASFNISGPASFSGSGKSATFNGAPAGTYTITFGAVAGYNVPASQTVTLTAGGTISFSGNYIPGSPVISLSTHNLDFGYAAWLRSPVLSSNLAAGLPIIESRII
jgi:hypothetical protein